MVDHSQKSKHTIEPHTKTSMPEKLIVVSRTRKKPYIASFFIDQFVIWHHLKPTDAMPVGLSTA